MGIKHGRITLALMLSFCIIALTYLTGCGGGSGGGGGGSEETFTNGGITLTTNITSSADSKTVTVSDADGVTTLTLVVTKTGATLSAPGEADYSMTFRTPLTELPTDFAAERMAIYVAGIRATEADLSARPDSPGCDWFPDSQCTLGCCADHDECYLRNNCGASSWIWFVGSSDCKNCNDIVYDCIAAACAGVTQSFTEQNCFDNRCGARYDCPPDYDNCTCVDACSGTTMPATCLNGICENGENLDNCFADCGFGSSPSACCVSHAWPNETGTYCDPADPFAGPCCCGAGYACDWHVGASPVQNVCVSSPD